MLKNNKRGYTLIEVLVVIAMIGFVATAAMYSLNNARMKSRDTKRVSDIKQIYKALELYYKDNNAYPYASLNGGWMCNDSCKQCQDGMYTNLSDYLTSDYISYIPDDPNNNSDLTGGCYWYVHRKNRCPLGVCFKGEGFWLSMTPENKNLLDDNTGCLYPDTYFSLCENYD